MVTKQFYYTRRIHITTRQDTRNKGRVYKKINIGKKIKTGPILNNTSMVNFDGIKKYGSKNAFQKPQNI